MADTVQTTRRPFLRLDAKHIAPLAVTVGLATGFGAFEGGEYLTRPQDDTGKNFLQVEEKIDANIKIWAVAGILAGVAAGFGSASGLRRLTGLNQ